MKFKINLKNSLRNQKEEVEGLEIRLKSRKRRIMLKSSQRNQKEEAEEEEEDNTTLRMKNDYNTKEKNIKILISLLSSS